MLMERDETKTIGKDYTLPGLLKFALPAILNEFVINLLYTIDDGLFITRYVGTLAESAFNILFPLFMLHGAISSLFAGVATLAARKMGEHRDKEACSDFTAIFLVSLFFGLILTTLEFFFMDPLLHLLGASELIYPYAKAFLKVGCLYTPLVLTGNLFARFYVPSGSPKMELLSTVLNIGSNVLFDWYFICHLQVGMVGTAYANLIANIIQNVIGLIYYSGKRCEVGFAAPTRKIFPLLKESFRYGLPSFLSNLSVGFGTLISNYAILHFGNESYLAAYAIVNNIAFTFMSGYFGLFSVTGPLLSYALGERNKVKLKRLFTQIFLSTGILIVATVLLFILLSDPLAELYTGEAAIGIRDLIVYGLKICPYGFLFFGYNVGARMSFTALGNYRSSTFITVFQEIIIANIVIIVLPFLFGIEAIWFAFAVTNVLTFLLTAYVVWVNRDNYGYGSSGLALLVENNL